MTDYYEDAIHEIDQLKAWVDVLRADRNDCLAKIELLTEALESIACGCDDGRAGLCVYTDNQCRARAALEAAKKERK